MKVKINLLIIAIILAIVTFGISTYLQKQLIHYEATASCLVLTEDISTNELVEKDKFKSVNVPISIIATQRIVNDFKEIEGLYAMDNIKAGQIVMRNQFDTKENLDIYEAEEGKEKISIKIKSAENGMSFQIKDNSYINVYATLRNEYTNGAFLEHEHMIIGDEFDGYIIVKLLENIKVLRSIYVGWYRNTSSRWR